MIPLAHITQWRGVAPWPDNLQVEQDLILSKLLVDIFSDPFLNQELAFRGGTALHKLFFDPAARYSEDIDLVRTSTGPIKKIVDSLRDCIDPWLGKPKVIRKDSSFKLIYYFIPESLPNIKLRIKIEINTRECFTCFERVLKEFGMQSDWFTGNTYINTYQFEELIATKLRALYQRKKGRDVFDLWLALRHENFNIEKVLQAFEFYMQKEGNIITRDEFIRNIEEKLQHRSFTDDIGPLLTSELKKTQSAYFATEEGKLFTAENNVFLTTEGWSLQDATKEIREKILMYLPK